MEPGMLGRWNALKATAVVARWQPVYSRAAKPSTALREQRHGQRRVRGRSAEPPADNYTQETGGDE